MKCRSLFTPFIALLPLLVLASPQAQCLKQLYSCEQEGSSWCYAGTAAGSRLKFCENGAATAGSGESGLRQRLPITVSHHRRCWYASQSLVYSCSTEPPNGPWIKLTACGSQEGLCCYVKQGGTSTLTNSYQTSLTDIPCTGGGVATP